VIHTDFQRGFIRAEAIGFEEFEGVGSMKKARDRGLIRSEGGDYEVEDGDILLFRFSA
jgi:ribosome-binding ATPase YchF (GTP1/OBG family)